MSIPFYATQQAATLETPLLGTALADITIPPASPDGIELVVAAAPPDSGAAD